MSEKRDWSKVITAIQSGNIEALNKVKNALDNSGNDMVDIEWSFEYQAEYNQIMSAFTLTPTNGGKIIDCTLAGFGIGNDTLAAAIASQLSPITTSGDGSYTGMVYSDYTPNGTVTVDGEVNGTVVDSNGYSNTFNFTKSIVIS